MRQALCLSLPVAAAGKIQTLAKKRGFESVSAYVRHLVAEDEELISEVALLSSAAAARREYKQGKSIKARSMADLLK
jgi:Arc/MetJ-type ribon-helix-helix transcriptional regulator